MNESLYQFVFEIRQKPIHKQTYTQDMDKQCGGNTVNFNAGFNLWFLADRITVALMPQCCVCLSSSSSVCDVMYCG